MESIPLARVPSQIFDVMLDGQDCKLALKWRQIRLYLDLDVNGTPVGRAMICENRSGIVSFSAPEFKGSLHFLDLEGDTPPHWETLHDGETGRHILLYRRKGDETSPILRY